MRKKLHLKEEKSTSYSAAETELVSWTIRRLENGTSPHPGRLWFSGRLRLFPERLVSRFPAKDAILRR
jgi:hypothetical protein